VTVLQPGGTDTAFFERADMLDTKVGASEHKDDPVDVAHEAVEAMLDGKDHVVTGWKNKLQMAMAQVTPERVKAKQSRRQMEPESPWPKP
jgi:short-subunit dehydrogenase